VVRACRLLALAHWRQPKAKVLSFSISLIDVIDLWSAAACVSAIAPQERRLGRRFVFRRGLTASFNMWPVKPGRVKALSDQRTPKHACGMRKLVRLGVADPLDPKEGGSRWKG
jgi:hypothetical protein